MKIQALLSAAALASLITSSFASTSDIASHRRADFFAPGKHQFYAWCTSGQDRFVAQDGTSAKDAEAKLLSKQSELAGCQLSWQGRIKDSLAGE
jgi:hypothetical protein